MEVKRKIKRDILQASFEAKACHIGSALSCSDLLVDLLYTLPKEDIFLFGKASGVSAYYAILADQGEFTFQEFVEYLKKYPLPSKEVPGVLHSFGSVGHALSVATGLAYADRTRNVHVLLSDGDCQEGSTLEAISFIRQHWLSNLHVIVDDNGFVACGPTDSIINLDEVYNFMRNSLPWVDIVTTIKGSGVKFMEGNYEWHYKNLTEETLKEALCQI